MPSVNRRAFFGLCAAGAAAPAVPHAAGSMPQASARSGATQPPPDQRLLTLIDGAAVTQMVYVAARTRVADHIGTGSPSVEELATATKMHADSLYRVLRALAGYGVFEELAGRRFRQTPVSQLLRSDAPRSMRAAAEVRGEDFFWKSWEALRDCVRAGETGHDLVYGENTLAAHASRLRFTGGDFFQAVPSGAQVYVMKYIVHDWEESKALAILANTRQAMPAGATMLLIEDLVCGPNVPCRAKLGDVNMLVRTGGRNRTREEYDALLTKGGFRVVRDIQAVGDLHILEAVVA